MPYANIREHLGSLVGAQVLDVTQHDEADWLAGDPAYFMLMFSNGSVLKVEVWNDGRIKYMEGNT